MDLGLRAAERAFAATPSPETANAYAVALRRSSLRPPDYDTAFSIAELVLGQRVQDGKILSFPSSIGQIDRNFRGHEGLVWAAILGDTFERSIARSPTRAFEDWIDPAFIANVHESLEAEADYCSRAIAAASYLVLSVLWNNRERPNSGFEHAFENDMMRQAFRQGEERTIQRRLDEMQARCGYVVIEQPDHAWPHDQGHSPFEIQGTDPDALSAYFSDEVDLGSVIRDTDRFAWRRVREAALGSRILGQPDREAALHALMCLKQDAPYEYLSVASGTAALVDDEGEVLEKPRSVPWQPFEAMLVTTLVGGPIW